MLNILERAACLVSVIFVHYAGATPADELIQAWEEIVESTEKLAESILPCGSGFLALAMDEDVQGNFLKISQLFDRVDFSNFSAVQMQQYTELNLRQMNAMTQVNKKVAACKSMLER